MNSYSKTIAAISTAMTNSGIGIVRISGEEAFDIIKKIYKGKKDKDLSKVKSHTIHYGNIVFNNNIRIFVRFCSAVCVALQIAR